jgi:hypothetical protein
MSRSVVKTIKVRMIALEVVGSSTVGTERAKRGRGLAIGRGYPRCTNRVWLDDRRGRIHHHH